MPLTLVTGGSRGIGAAICVRLASEGHDVVVAYRRDAEAAERVASAVRSLGRTAQTLQVDTASEQSVDAMFAAIDGQLTGLVNNAGISGGNSRLIDADADGMRHALEVNVLGYLLVARGALRAFNGSGSIVNISSGAATLGGANRYVHYAASKAAVDGMTVGLAKEVAADGVRVNAVSPGTVATAFVDRLLQNFADPVAERAAMDARQAIGRMVLPHEVANAIAYLASPLSAATTGTALDVDGGVTHLRVRPV